MKMIPFIYWLCYSNTWNIITDISKGRIKYVTLKIARLPAPDAVHPLVGLLWSILDSHWRTIYAWCDVKSVIILESNSLLWYLGGETDSQHFQFQCQCQVRGAYVEQEEMEQSIWILSSVAILCNELSRELIILDWENVTSFLVLKTSWIFVLFKR